MAQKRVTKQTHSSISRIHSIPSNDAAKDLAWSALVRGALVKVWLADTGNWQVCINELLTAEEKRADAEFRKAFTPNKYGELA